METDRIMEDSNQTAKNPLILLDAATAISSKLDIDTIAVEAAYQIARLLNADSCLIGRWDPQTKNITLWATHNEAQEQIPASWYQSGDLTGYPSLIHVLEAAIPAQVHLDDSNSSSAEKRLLAEINAQSLLVLPLASQEHILGLVGVFDKKSPRTFHDHEIAVAQLLANHIGTAIERAGLLRDAEQRAAELEALRKASLTLTASLDLEEVLYKILESALSLLKDALDAHIFLYDGVLLTFAAALWEDGRKGEAWAQVREDGLTYTVARSAEMIVIPDMGTHPLYANAPSHWKGSIIGLPLTIGDRVVGVMSVAYKEPRTYSQAELRVISLLADQAAIAIENARLHDLVKQQALTDTLTTLPNRRAFDRRLEEEIRRSSRYQHSFALMILDFNGFKRINDTYGHPVGDRTLKKIAVCLKGSVRDTDFVARFGGDEFVIIMPETGTNDADLIGRKLRKAITECSFEWRTGTADFLTLSFGAAVYPTHATNASGLLKAADIALYKAKETER